MYKTISHCFYHILQVKKEWIHTFLCSHFRGHWGVSKEVTGIFSYLSNVYQYYFKFLLLKVNPCLLAKYLYIIKEISASETIILYSLKLNISQTIHIGHKLTFGIFSINLAVFLLWKIPAAKPFMIKYFASNPAVKKNCLPMLLCAFR